MRRKWKIAEIRCEKRGGREKWPLNYVATIKTAANLLSANVRTNEQSLVAVM